MSPRRILVLLLVLALSGGHLAMLQTVAWTGMLVSRIQGSSLAEAVSSTFSGDAPCALCCAVQKLRSDHLGAAIPDQKPTDKVVKQVDPLPMTRWDLTIAPATADGGSPPTTRRLESVAPVVEPPPPQVG